MNKNLFLLLFFVFPFVGWAQITERMQVQRGPCFQKSLDRLGNPYAEWECGQSLEIVDCNEKLEADPGSNLVFSQASGKPFTGACESCYMNGLRQRIVQFSNGLVDGIDTTFYQSGCPQVVRSHIQGVENGTWTYYNDTSGLVAWEINYANGEKDGRSIYFRQHEVGETSVKVKIRGAEENIYYKTYENDTLKLEYYKNGQLDGVKKEYWPGSRLKMRAEYKNGLLDGKYIRYDLKETILEELSYKEGQKDGESKYYYNDGKLMRTENWKKGIKEGEFTTYYIQGYIQIKETYRKGLKHGEFLEYFPDNKIKREAIYKKDVLVEEHVFDKYGNEIRTVGKEDGKNKKEDDDIPEEKKNKSVK